jgi:hypothetical protein
MPSNAFKRFTDSASDIDHLIDLHETMVNVFEADAEPVPEGYEVVFRSAVVLMVSHWEAYIEDICSEALDHLVRHTTDPTKLPKEIKKQVAGEIKRSSNEIEVWKLADAGWKAYLRGRLAAFKELRDRSFNTPKAENTADFIKRTLGIEDVRSAWSFDGKDSKAISEQLDRLVAIRGEIAHRGRLQQRLDAKFVTQQTAFLRHLASKTGGTINTHLKKATGTALF